MTAARIVLVDDSIADVQLLRIALDEQGKKYELEVLRTGDDALRFVNDQATRGGSDNPCVILLDLHLPRHDGLDVLAAIRSCPELAHVHVVVLSGSANPAQREQVQSLGATYVQKPLELADYFALGTKVMDICSSAVAATA